MNFAGYALFVIAVIFSKTCVDATICEPLSTFRIDCDECQCSENGKEYSCTIRRCGATSFLNEDDEDSYVLADEGRNAKIEIPYLNDEIPPSREVLENEFDDDIVYDEVKDDSDERNSNEETIEDVSLGEQDASVFDTGLPDEYRYKRYINPKGKRYINPKGKRYINPKGKRYVNPNGKRYINPMAYTNPKGKRNV